MKWTYDWLKEYLDTKASATEIAEMLTRTGLEVEDLSEPVLPIAAKIVECKPHENSDHLHVLQVDDGSGNLRQVVCGAPNAKEGLVSALAVPGCVIQGHKIESGKLRGILSDGMMCSGKELGINEDHSGIIELPADTKIGSPVCDMATVFEAGITPNRPDYLSVRGIARDLSATGIGTYIVPSDTELEPVATKRKVNVLTDKCPVYRFAEISGITVKPSDKIIANRLAAIGINPKNSPIDATNYICYDMAQPLHCFDADEIAGDITVRQAKEDEEFTDLFGNSHKLKETDIVIADEHGPLALAGVVGGARGMTTDNTKNIILESAYFNPVSVRKTAKRLGMSTDASYRYERGIDPKIGGVALAKVAKIIMDTCGGTITGTGIGGANDFPTVKIEYRPSLLKKKTGIEIEAEVQKEILEKLGNKIEVSGDAWIITPLTSRVDMTLPENVVSELIRIYGYDKIADNAKRRPNFSVKHNDYNLWLKQRLTARGLNEAKSFGFGNSKTESLLSDKPVVKIANPITADMDTARSGLLGNLLKFVADNEKRGYPDLDIFELGTVFDGDKPNEQHTQICIVRTGQTSPKHWQRRNRAKDIYDVKADIIDLINNQNFTVCSENSPLWAHPFRYGAVYQGKKKIAEFGELHPSVAKALKIKTSVMIAIVDDIENLPGVKKCKEPKLTEYQPISRDFAFIVNSDALAEKLTLTAMSSDKRISDAVVFDSFDMGDGKKSIAFTITILPTENMTDEELLKIQDSVIKNVESKCNATIRDK